MGVEAYSSGVKASGKVNPNAKKVLQNEGIWEDRYHSKTLDEVLDIEYDLVITVCDNAQESCPTFPKETTIVHISYEDPDGKSLRKFEETLRDMKMELIPIVRIELEL
jgi:arsenate reductase